ncbi:ATP-binding protein [Halolamina sp. CBA1230]|uniref:ATP-binding protein n=1 Tax=Halolamina sp. CBA1230 TaxID=1853690 RepID=UPI0009A22C5F|nr:ATP-binding protein [Halolamina sp. CBA1230]QKY20600.1 ATP-binding protein [Halolamina sp. CBA1230]
MSKGGDSSVYAAAQGREFLRDELQGKSNEFIREFAGLVDDPEVLDLLNYYCSLWRDEPEDFLEIPIGREILQNAATRTTDRAFRDGNVSQLQGMVGLTNQNGDGQDLIGRAAKSLTNEGAIGLVLGPPGAGKTALTLDVARAWGARTGGLIISNTDWEGADKVVNSDMEMLEAMAEYDGPVLALIDETAQELSGYGTESKKAEAFANALTFVRKAEEDHGPYAKKGSVLMVNHTRMRTAASFRRLATFALEKPSRDDPSTVRYIETEGGQDDLDSADEQTYQGVTDSREKYAEHEASSFEITLHEDDSEGDDVDPDDAAESAEWEAQARTAIQAYQPWDDDAGMSYREISKDGRELVGYGKGWVSDRVLEWRDGQHRDLVPDPTDTGEGDSE